MPTNEVRSSRLSSFMFGARSAAVAAVAGALTLGAHAQQVVQPSTENTNAAPALLFAGISSRPMDLATLAGVNYSSSSDSLSAEDASAADPATLDFMGTEPAMQPPPRRYGHPRYNDSSHNSDGSSKYTFEAGVGLTLPTGNTYHYFNTSYGFSVGGGRQFNKHLAVLLQFDYDRFGVNGQTLDNQITLYNDGCSAIAGNCLPQIDGNNHVWSFTVDPTYTFYQGDKVGAYVVVGAGFYHKVTNFTTPETGEECEGLYGCFEVTENANIDHYTSNAVGFNGGFGLTYKFSRFAGERLFIEGRYVFVNNSQRTGLTVADSTSAPYGTVNAPASLYSGYDYFPANSNKTTYIPIKVGIRF